MSRPLVRQPRQIIRYRLLLITTLIPGSLISQQASPNHRWIVEQFFFANAWPAKAEYYAGEMTTHYATAKTMGEAGAPVRRGSMRLVQASESQAVYTVQVGRGERIEDWYAYVTRGPGGWRLTAVRTLALPPLFFMAMDSLSGAQSLPDSLAEFLANMRLTASSDSALREFFRGHRTELQRIAEGFSRETARSIAAAPAGLQAPTASLQELARQLALLHLGGAWRDPELTGCTFVEIGGMIDNEVGFMRCTGVGPPPITPERFILIEPLADGWYLYKTT